MGVIFLIKTNIIIPNLETIVQTSGVVITSHTETDKQTHLLPTILPSPSPRFYFSAIYLLCPESAQVPPTQALAPSPRLTLMPCNTLTRSCSSSSKETFLLPWLLSLPPMAQLQPLRLQTGRGRSQTISPLTAPAYKLVPGW